MQILFVIGTRPEAIKVAPLILEAQRQGVNATVCVTAQHRGLLDQALAQFGVVPDFDLNLMQSNQRLNSLASRAIAQLDKILQDTSPDWVVAQGDTTTCMAAGLGAFYAQIPFAHVEAGLRSHDISCPFPEEFNRHIADRAASVHFAPTPSAAENLRHEGFSETSIVVTGNTGIDALLIAHDLPVHNARVKELTESNRQLVLVTAHRRESFGAGMKSIASALQHLSRTFPEASIVFPLHPNPNVQRVMRSQLSDTPNITLFDPLDYVSFVKLMASSSVILTDSGGVQEEAPSFGVPTIVMRERTERPEALAGNSRLVGLDSDLIFSTASSALEEPKPLKTPTNPFGDGLASSRIVNFLTGAPWTAFEPENSGAT